MDQRRAFSFKLKPGGNDYANCLGVYKAAVDEGEINGKPYYVNEKKGRFAAWNGEMWEITALFYLPGIKSTHLNHGYWSREFGGFHVGGGARIDDNGWKDYFVTEAVPTSFEFITKPGLMAFEKHVERNCERFNNWYHHRNHRCDLLARV